MNIKPSANIRQNYNEIAELCKKTGEPVYLTKNGEGDLVVMDINAFSRREKMLKLREELISVEEERLAGGVDFSKLTVKRYKIVISQRAKSEIENHINFLARVNIEAAKSLKSNIIKDIKSLEFMPQRNSFLINEFISANKYHRMLCQKRYLLLYQIKDDTVYLVLVIDCRQDYSWLIGNC